MATLCPRGADDVFGPIIDSGCRGGFDFTLLFEQTIFGILPASIFLLSAPIRVIALARANVKTVAGPLTWAKLLGAVIFIALQVTLLVLWAVDDSSQTKASVASAAVNLAVAIHFLALSWLEDSRSVRPSSLLNVYLLFTVLLDLPQSRTLWLRDDSTPIAGLFTASVALKTVLGWLEAADKTPYLQQGFKSLPPESTSGIINRSFLWWVNDLFRRGLRAVITLEDLYVLDGNLTSAGLSETFQHAWRQRRQPERRFELPWLTIKAFWRPFCTAAVPRLCLIGFTFAQPFLITRVLDLLGQPDNQTTRNEGYGLIGATAIIYLGISISSLHYNQSIYRFITMFRGATVALIYDHALSLQVGVHEDSAAVTLMSTDVDRIARCLAELNECWARVMEVAIGITLLALQLGWVCVVPIITVVVAFFGTSKISATIGGRQKIWVDAVQKRIGIISSMLADMRSVKMMGYSRILASIAQNQRVEETHKLAGYYQNIMWQNIVQNLPWILAPALTFAVYAGQAIAQGESSIGTTKAFTSLSIITLLTDPTAKLLSAIPSTASSLGCFDRIQSFLVTSPKGDPRRVFGTQTASSGITITSASLDVESVERIHAKTSSKDSRPKAIAVEAADLRPALDADAVLRNVNITIAPGSVTMVVGPIGSGKTTFLRAILGEVAPTQGSITVSSTSMALCTQSPWLRNTTVRQAICGPVAGSDLDEKWYEATLHACALDHDLDSLPQGENTQIGSGGTTLSGGQKHRIALARAVFSRAKIIVLDDILSALDKTTQRAVFSRLLGENGLLRKIGATVVLATHATEYLSSADQVVILSDGEVRYAGAYDGAIKAKMLDEVLVEVNTLADEPAASAKPEEKAELIAEANQRQDLTRATGDWEVYRYYFKVVGWPRMSIFTGFVIINVFAYTFSQIWLKWWTDVGGEQIALYSSIYIALAIITTIGLAGYVWVMLMFIAPSTARKFHSILLDVVMRAPQSFFSKTDTGSILNRFSQDMSLIEGQLPTGVLVSVSNLFMCIAGAGLIATGSAYMAISIPFLIIAICALQHVYLRTSRQLRLLDLEARSPLYSHFLESLQGLVTIRAFGWEDAAIKENQKLLDISQQPYYLMYCIQRWLSLVLDLIVGAEAVLVVGLAISLRSSTSAGLLGVSLNSVLSFSQTLASLVTGWTLLETSLGSISRLKSFEESVQPEDKASEDFEPPDTWPEHGCIEFCDVTALHDSEVVGIRNIDFKITSGQKVGICGRTGSGKSSLIATLLRLLEIDSGQILVDGADLATIPRETIRERLVALPQDPLILAGTVRLNADPPCSKSDPEIVAAFERVGLWSTLEDRGGLDAELTASSLSRGQQQLFALARAMLKQSKILLLDEATSSVDSETDATMQRVLREDFSDCTVITVAHRLHTIIDSDLIVVMEDKEVVEIGTPRELLQVDGGKFASLVRG